MSGGITDPPTKKERLPFYEAVAQGATAKQLRESLADIPDEAEVVWVDSYVEEAITFGQASKTTVGIGFKWNASPKP